MADVLTRDQRRYCMSRIKGKDTKPELRLRKFLWTLGYRYRLKSRLPGKPDLVFSGSKVVIFVDGCFWHGCLVHRVYPKTNSDFWEKKLKRTIEIDQQVNEQLIKQGWKVLRFWEHEVERNLEECIARIISALNES